MEVDQPTGTRTGAFVPTDAARRQAAAHFSRARDLHGTGKFDDAAREYAAALAVHPDYPEALHLFGVLEFQRGNAAASEALLRQSAALAAEANAVSDLGAVLAANGKADEGMAQLERALQLDRNHVQTLVRRANMLMGLRRYEEALAGYDRTLAVSPLTLDALCNRGAALRALGRLQEAVESYQRALTVDARSFESFYNLANVLRDLQRNAEALQNYDHALAIVPNHADILSARGRTLVDLGRAREALTSFNEAIATRPDFVEAIYNSAVALERLGRAEEALQRCDRVLALEPDHAKALAARGNALLHLTRYEEAAEAYRRSLELEPGAVDALCNRGTALRHLERHEEALSSYEAALAGSANFPEAWCNRGNVLQDLHRYEEAMNSYDRAIATSPKYATAWFNRGNVLLETDRLDAAMQAYDKAVALDPNYTDAHFAQGFIHLVQGEFASGWPKYEWRLRDPKSEHSRRGFAQPRWTGEQPLQGRTILLHAEQGFGDTIQFCRYVERLADAGARVVLEVQPALQSLLAPLRGAAQVIAAGDPLPAHDYQCPLLSLPFAFKTDLATIPAGTPYLHANPELMASWAEMLGAKRRMRVGVAWSGNPEHRNDRNRSMELATLLPLLDLDIEWINLQKIVRGRDIAVLEASPLRNFDADMRDFSDTAALMESLDLVIAVDTAVAHLAGALDRPVWILLPHLGEWRWLRERGDSPWYPSARLFRQPAPGRWQDLIGTVRQELVRLL
ncbi:tetratricopeptide repeat protein [Paraburkholderia solisilvae]|uniref:Photosystem I assembly protein Ycf3 n=1 Tax=Paraburkholderia solisilvae TaxID=624376 RepID=A0A6J5D1M7_9BURK|nr:tetratricopeptide repeat protein [Paraburkholderia solisilvae]CAB3748128.1 Photosystem I assembly protein Ycf3 [Paraburkholderia solisilvae]